MKRHLSDIEIAAYLDGRLSSEQKERIQQDLSNDDSSWDDFVAISRVIGGTVPDPSPICPPEYLVRKVLDMYPERQDVFDIVIGLLRDAVKVVHTSFGIGVSTPLPAADLRNHRVLSPRMAVFTKSFETITAEFDIEKVAGDFCNIRVIVIDNSTKSPVDSLRVELVSAGRELASARVRNGEILFEDISPGRYTVRMHRNGKALGELAIKIKG